MYFLGRGVSRIARSSRPVTNARNLATSNSDASNLLAIHPEVAHALVRGQPVVALESTVITHGLTYPENLKTAISCEENVRANGAVPATIALLNGKLHVGLEEKQLEILADVESLKNSGKAPVKLSRRDIAPAMSLGQNGGTTIAGTTIIAHLAGIKVFATGGLGGVHRGGEITWDVSADLTELGRTPIAVVASGAKSILDIGRTLEVLETQGVTVAAYDNDGNWPAFFTPRSGHKAPWAFNNPKDAAKSIYLAEKLGLQSGTIFGVPIPKEFESVGLEIQAAVDQAVRESEENGVAKSGRDTTPWLLNRVKELTKGVSVPSNVALLENNARIGARIAVEYAKLKANRIDEATSSYQSVFINTPTSKASIQATKSPLVVVGAAAMDITAQPTISHIPGTHSTSPGIVRMSPGGVARNVTEAAHRVLKVLSPASEFEAKRPLLISPVGQDTFATALTFETESRGMRVDGLLKFSSPSVRTAVCNMFLDAKGDLQMGVADMGSMAEIETGLTKVLEKLEAAAPKIVAIDGNESSSTTSAIIEKAKAIGSLIFYEPTSTAKCTRIIPAISQMLAKGERDPYITGSFPNIIELRVMWELARSEEGPINSSYWWQVVDKFGPDLHRILAGQIKGNMTFLVNDGIIQMATQLVPFIKHLIIKCGSKGVVVVAHITDKEGAMNWVSGGTQSQKRQVVVRGSDGSALVVHYFPAHTLDRTRVHNVTGAGDTLVGALLASLVHDEATFHQPEKLEAAINLAQRCAVLTIGSELAVSPAISSISHPSNN
ncbi:indigoidine synthase A family protein [Rhizoctonia solani AG-3 Rhs1AP]|uniref:Indigoidine synthase A family protein n=1 Tax=Rhizoctonia solani AG-3 Rhs1AP TaxID=1086054 RepID=X8JN45_9AGAM|nr:indigoidine synthase A family protein [Rhizoctonia solani AG-3 Rhs1AP]